MEVMVTSVAHSIDPKPQPVQARAGGFDAYARFDVGTSDANVPAAMTVTEDSQRTMRLVGACLAESDCGNQQYSITAVTTSAGAVTERYAYTAYGLPTILDASASVLSSSAISNRYTYTGREWDATLGLHYFRARWMSPIAGRFLGRDPIAYEAGDVNLYRVTFGFALNRTDPSGMQTELPYRPPHYIPPSVSPTGRRGRVVIDFEKTKSKRCIFYSDPFPGQAGIDGIPLNGGKRIPFRSMDDVIGVILKNSCCEIIFAGHQGGVENPGGISGMIECNPYDPSNSRRIKWALGIIGCDGCSLILAGCGLTLPNADTCRQSLAKDTGCDVFASGDPIEIPKKGTIPRDAYCTLDSKQVGHRCPFGGNWALWPWIRYSP